MRKKSLNFKLTVSFLREGNKFIAYSPALDLSTSGNTFEKVQKRFSEIVNIFFEELIHTNTMEKTLLDLGWKKKKKEWQPPVMIAQESKSIQVFV